MWPVLVEFRSANAEGSGRKEKEKEDRIAVKPESADKDVGRPNKVFLYVSVDVSCFMCQANSSAENSDDDYDSDYDHPPTTADIDRASMT